MLTFRAGAAGSPSAAGAMADHLREQTLPAGAAELARYYQAGMVADFAGDMVADSFAVHAEKLLNAGLPLSALPDALAASIEAKHGDWVDDWLGQDQRPSPTLEDITRLAEWTVVQAQPGSEAAFIDYQLERDGDVVREVYAGAVGEAGYRLDKVLELAGDNAHGHTAAAPRRDMNPALAARLGLDLNRSPTRDEIANLLNGQRADGAAIAGQQRQKATEIKARIGYYDLTFSADKSLSVAWAFAPTEAERNLLAQAHRDAVASAMAYVANEIGRARMGAAGKRGSEVGHIGWIAFDHYTARPTVEIARTSAKGEAYTELLTLKTAGDPQLHSHVAVPNVVLTDGGRIGGLDANRLANRVHEFGAVYQAYVATNLRRLGVEVGLDPKTGAARLAAIPERVRDRFSKRTRNGTEAARAYARDKGLDWDTLSPERRVGLVKEGTQTHTQGKAPRKDDIGDWPAWKEQAAELGWSHRSVLRPDGVFHVKREERLEAAFQSALPLLDAALERRAKLDGQDVRTFAARGLVASGIDTPADIDAVTRAFRERGVQQNGQNTALIWGDDAPVRGQRRVGVTTAMHANGESEFIGLARRAATDKSGDLAGVDLGRAISRSGLKVTAEQQTAMRGLTTNGKLAVAIGVAGSGKTTMLAPLVDAWQREGRAVYGVALAWRQAEALTDTGIPRERVSALAPFLMQDGKGLDRRSVVVVDEIGQVGTRQMLDLLRLRERIGFGIVAIGDPRQAQSIEAGPVMGLLSRALGDAAIPQLRQTHRQQTQEERATSLLFREGRAAEAIAAKLANGTARTIPGDRHAAIEAVASLWRARVEAGASITVSAPTNSDARAIGAAIRADRQQRGEVGPDLRTVQATDQNGARYDLPLAVGDRVRLFARAGASFGGTAGNIGANGSVLEVRAMDEQTITLRAASGNTGRVKWKTLADPMTGRTRLSYGDVLTIDAVQGATSAEHIHAMPSGSAAVDGFKAYVAESRHRATTWLVTADGAERREVANRRPLGDGRPIQAADVWDNVARNLSRQTVKVGALDFLERAHSLRRGSVGSLMSALQRREQAAVDGKAGKVFHVKHGEIERRMPANREPSRQVNFAAIPERIRDALFEQLQRLRPGLDAVLRSTGLDSANRARRGLRL